MSNVELGGEVPSQKTQQPLPDNTAPTAEKPGS